MEGMSLHLVLLHMAEWLFLHPGPAVSLFDSMRELLSFTDYLLLQNIEGKRRAGVLFKYLFLYFSIRQIHAISRTL